MKNNYPQYRNCDLKVYNVGHRSAICYNWQKDLYKSYTIQALELLNRCKEFKTIDQHAYDIVKSQQIRSLLRSSSTNLIEKLKKFLTKKMMKSGGEIPVSSGQVHVVRQQLEMFARHGLLISNKELEEQLSTIVSSTSPSLESNNHLINQICIPTRNRSDQRIK